jgi:hypothetical protein
MNECDCLASSEKCMRIQINPAEAGCLWDSEGLSALAVPPLGMTEFVQEQNYGDAKGTTALRCNPSPPPGETTDRLVPGPRRDICRVALSADSEQPFSTRRK